MFTTENALDLTARKTHWATSVFKLLALSAWNSDLLLNWFGHLQFQMCYWDAVSQHIIHFWYGSLNGMLDHVQFSQPNLSICQALVAFATNHSRASQVRLLGGSKRTWFDHFLPKFGRLLISESTASNFWMSFLQFLTWICLNMGHPRIQWFYRWSSVFFIVPQKKKQHMGRASCAAYSLRLHKRSSHLLKSSQIIQFRFPSFLDKILVLFQCCCFFFSRVNVHMWNPPWFPWAHLR